MEKNRKKISNIIDELEELGNKYDFRNLETALCIWLRGNLNDYNDEELEELDQNIYDYDGSLLCDEIKDYIDSISY